MNVYFHYFQSIHAHRFINYIGSQKVWVRDDQRVVLLINLRYLNTASIGSELDTNFARTQKLGFRGLPVYVTDAFSMYITDRNLP